MRAVFVFVFYFWFVIRDGQWWTKEGDHGLGSAFCGWKKSWREHSFLCYAISKGNLIFCFLIHFFFFTFIPFHLDDHMPPSQRLQLLISSGHCLRYRYFVLAQLRVSLLLRIQEYTGTFQKTFPLYCTTNIYICLLGFISDKVYKVYFSVGTRPENFLGVKGKGRKLYYSM